MSYKSKYTGAEVESLLDKVASGDIGGDIDLEGYATKEELAQKQDVIEDIDDIRAGAMKGSTALQSVPDEYVTEEELVAKGYITEHQDISGLATKEELSQKQDIINDIQTIREGASKGATAIQSIPEEYVTEEELQGKSYATVEQLNKKVDASSLSEVAISGSYDDLKDKPTIPNEVSESTVSGWGFTKNEGTVTGVMVNGVSKTPSNGIVDLGYVLTEHQDISGKQDKLISGQNIKTFNGESILGEGNIEASIGANVQAVDIQEEVETLEEEYATIGYINTLFGDLDEILTSIIEQ